MFRYWTYCMFILHTPLIHRIKYKYMQTRPFMLWLLLTLGAASRYVLPLQISCSSHVKQLTIPWICRVSHFMLSQTKLLLCACILPSPHQYNYMLWLNLHILSDPINTSPLKLSRNPQAIMNKICIYLCYCIKCIMLHWFIFSYNLIIVLILW